jgi:hypothetical protein
MARASAVGKAFGTSARARVIVDSLEHALQDPDKLIPIYALMSRIRLSSSREVLDSAERIVKTIVQTYAQPNLTLEDIRSRAVKGDDPLREFPHCLRHPVREGLPTIRELGHFIIQRRPWKIIVHTRGLVFCFWSCS